MGDNSRRGTGTFHEPYGRIGQTRLVAAASLRRTSHSTPGEPVTTSPEEPVVNTHDPVIMSTLDVIHAVTELVRAFKGTPGGNGGNGGGGGGRGGRGGRGGGRGGRNRGLWQVGPHCPRLQRAVAPPPPPAPK
ncbi:hypothetical protein G7Z17_g8999 [Cylindrodendrum hubeiense]|uniref:Uncharacterized protein n=1 Tax=Cylindrodendrum hubeiense TaxID=595255 RepID=A0A9P5H152_9HYPO|nr:hypothetical protein G7Z17_g8999 [Cylindrodendrum hubeiense]